MKSPTNEPQPVAQKGAAQERPSAKVLLVARIMAMQCKLVVSRQMREALCQWHQGVTLGSSHADTAVQTHDFSTPESSESVDRDSGAEPSSSSQGTSEETQVYDATPFKVTQSSRSTWPMTKGAKTEGAKTSRDPPKSKGRRQRGEKQKRAQP